MTKTTFSGWGSVSRFGVATYHHSNQCHINPSGQQILHRAKVSFLRISPGKVALARIEGWQIHRNLPCKGTPARVAAVALHVKRKILYVQGALCYKMPKTCKRSSARASSRGDRAKIISRRAGKSCAISPDTPRDP